MLKIKTSNYELHKRLKHRPRLAMVGVGSFLLLAVSTVGLLALAHQSVAITPQRTAATLIESDITTKPTPAVTPQTSGSTAAAAGGAPVNTKKTTPVAAAPTPQANTISLAGTPLYVDPNNSASAYATSGVANSSLIARLGQQPVATWFGGWNADVAGDVSAYVSRATVAHAMPVLVAYNIPNRDCGGYSAGGAQTEAAYATWIAQFTNGIGNRPALVILEPDAISLQSCLSADQLAARNRELSNAITTLTAGGSTHVYLDAGHSGWVGANDTANRLKAAGIAGASGFSLNISNFTTTDSNIDFGSQVSRLVGGKHFVIDTSRNGNGPAVNGEWCNPAGRALGAAPTTSTGNSLADAYLWIKTPWQSDGTCNGAPPAGVDYWDYALKLAQVAGW